jgi:hypothetical protein
LSELTSIILQRDALEFAIDHSIGLELRGRITGTSRNDEERHVVRCGC